MEARVAYPWASKCCFSPLTGNPNPQSDLSSFSPVFDRKMPMSKRRCFVISPIGKEGSEVRKHADDVLAFIVRPAVATCDVVAYRADELHEPGRITDQMFREILNADFCIALLTGQNPNVFYELAVAQSAGKPVIVLAEKREELPFDVKDMRCLYYDFDPRAIRDKVYEKQLVEYMGSLERQDWRAESLLQRFGKNLPRQALPDSYSFEQLTSEIDRTLKNLGENDGELLLDYKRDGDAERLFDGLYSSILYASRAATTGVVDAIFYGNLMELDVVKRQLRVRYFAGPYNEEVTTRSFPIARRGQGIATIAFNSQKIQVVNSMGQELKVKGEARLNAMICVPIPGANQRERSRQVVLLNIDSGTPDVFPTSETLRTSPAGGRLERLAALVSRTNVLYRWIVEGAQRTEAAVTPRTVL